LDAKQADSKTGVRLNLRPKAQGARIAAFHDWDWLKQSIQARLK